MSDYIRNILLAFDQFAGSFIPKSYPDESISSRAYREDWELQELINWLFNDPKHCEDSYWSEVNNRQNFPKDK